MQELRLVLIIVGALAIAALLLHGLWSSRKEKPAKFSEKPLGKLSESSRDSDGFDKDGVGSVRVVNHESPQPEPVKPERKEPELHFGAKLDVDPLLDVQPSTQATPQPVAEQPVTEQPATQQPGIQQPSIQQPVIQEPMAQQPVVSSPTDFVEVAPTPELQPHSLQPVVHAPQTAAVPETVTSEAVIPAMAPHQAIVSETVPETVSAQGIASQTRTNTASQTVAPQPVASKAAANKPVRAEPTFAPVVEESEHVVPQAEKQPQATAHQMAFMPVGSDSQAQSDVVPVDVAAAPISHAAQINPAEAVPVEQVVAEPVIVEPEVIPEPEPEVLPPDYLMLGVHARNGHTLRGSKLFNAFEQNNLIFGENSVYHRHLDKAGTGPIIFTVTNMVHPAHFPEGGSDNFETPGVAFYLMLPAEAGRADEHFNLMLQTVQRIADTLGADVLDHERSLITPRRISQYREKAHRYTNV